MKYFAILKRREEEEEEEAVEEEEPKEEEGATEEKEENDTTKGEETWEMRMIYGRHKRSNKRRGTWERQITGNVTVHDEVICSRTVTLS